MPEDIAIASFSEIFTIRPVTTFRHHNRAVAIIINLGFNLGQKLVLIEFHFGKQYHDRNIVFLIGSQTAGCGNPSGMAPHDLDDKNIAVSYTHLTLPTNREV